MQTSTSNPHSCSITRVASQTLTALYPVKIVDDFRQYLDDEEYDSEALKDDLKEEEPFCLEYLIAQNPSIFHTDAQKQQLLNRLKQLLLSASATQSNPRPPVLANIVGRNQQWVCRHCTFHNEANEQICSVCHRETETETEAEQDAQEEQEEEKHDANQTWHCVYLALLAKYGDAHKQECNRYFSALTDIIARHKFSMEDANEDLNEFAVVGNDSLIAEGIMDAFGWKQDSENTLQLVACLKQALCSRHEHKDEDDIYQVQDDGDKHELKDAQAWQTRIATIIGLRRDDKYNDKLAKYAAFGHAMAVFGDRELCCLLRLYLRHKMNGSLNVTADLVQFARHRFAEKCEALQLDEERLGKLFQIAFGHRLVAHASIFRKLDTAANQQRVDVQRIQIALIASVLRMTEYFRKYRSCHSIFCLRFVPEPAALDAPAKHEESRIKRLLRELEATLHALKQAETQMMSGQCWVFVADLSNTSKADEHKHAEKADEVTAVPRVHFEAREQYDDEAVTLKTYNAEYRESQLYHLKQLDYRVCKENDNVSMALQVSFHKYDANNCVSWLTHSCGHVPFFETDIIRFIPRLFAASADAVTEHEWKQILQSHKITELQAMDRMYSELQHSFYNFRNQH